jgi:hypothetical protein
MSDSKSILKSLTEALPEEADARDELVAIGGLAGAIINTTAPEGRADLVECFCKTLRKAVATELN